jgi:hypothetical protein
MSNELEKEIPAPTITGDSICPDFDEDCKFVKDHLKCFLGLPFVDGGGNNHCLGTAKGYCPFIHAKS